MLKRKTRAYGAQKRHLMAAEMIIDWINIMKKNRAPAARDEETNSHTPRYCIDNEESHFPLLEFLKKSYFLYLPPHLDFKKILERNFDQNPTPNPLGSAPIFEMFQTFLKTFSKFESKKNSRLRRAKKEKGKTC